AARAELMRALAALYLALLVAPAALPQTNPSSTAEPGHTTETAKPGGGETKSEGDEDKWLGWNWANFLILGGALVYLTRKSVAAFFTGRTESIRRDIDESKRLREDAEKRAAEIDRRLGALGAEIDKIGREIRAEFAHDGERIRKETERHVERIQHQAEQEIEAIARGAREDLRRNAAKLALEIAEQRIRERVDEPAQSRLVSGFVRSLDRLKRNGEGRA